MNQYFERIPAHKTGLGNTGGASLGHLDIELTERCNNNCIHCCINLPVDDKTAQDRESSTEDLKKILGEAAELGCLTVRFTGGEPLLRDDFEELYTFARRLGLRVSLATNGRLITAEIAELFVRIPPLTEMEVSIYGMHAESYEAVTRVPGSYVQFRRGVDLLLEKNIPFVVSGALLPPNRAEMNEFESWSSTIPWMKSPPMYVTFLDLRKRRDSAEKNKQIRSLRLTSRQALAVLNRRPQQERRSWIEFCRKRMEPRGDWLFACGIGIGGSVDAYGRFQPCLSLCAPEWTHDLRAGSLRAALDSLRPGIRNARATNPEYLKRCARCFIHSMCNQCPAKSWIENGTLDTPVEYLCETAHYQSRALGLIHGKEKSWEVGCWQDRTERLSS